MKRRLVPAASDEQRPGDGRVVLVIDNYDSFTYNLVQYLLELGAQVEVVRNDEITVAHVRTHEATHLLMSPGPGRPLWMRYLKGDSSSRTSSFPLES